MRASEASLEAARLWLAGAQAAGMAVAVVGDRVYCGADKPQQFKALLAAMPGHKNALLTMAEDEDDEARFKRARAMYPGPEVWEMKR